MNYFQVEIVEFNVKELIKMNENLLTTDQTAKILNVSTRTIRFWEKQNKLTRVPVNIIGTKKVYFHKLDVERLFNFINKDVVVSRRPANVFFTTLEKPPRIIDWISFTEKELEIFTYIKVDINKEKKLCQISEENGWTKWGYQNIELKDSDVPYKFISINNQDWCLPSAGDFFDSTDKKILNKSSSTVKESYSLVENNSRLIIIHDDKSFINEKKETVSGCPPFMFFHYYDIINNEVKICSNFFASYPKYSK